MDLYAIIDALRRERERIVALMEALERAAEHAATPPPAPTRRRGRKRMNGAERQEVSRRMKLYWEKRKRESSGILGSDSSVVGD